MENELLFQLKNRNREIAILKEKIEDRDIIIKQLKRQIIYFTDRKTTDNRPTNIRGRFTFFLIYTLFIFISSFVVFYNYFK